MDEICAGCTFYYGEQEKKIGETPIRVGGCRRFPPTVFLMAGLCGHSPFSTYPETSPLSWCGEWKGKK